MDHHSPGSKESLEVGAVKMERNVLVDPITDPWDDCIFTYMNACFFNGKCRYI